MKSTGITRRVDELGRIVIPKEIRKNLGIREGESLEFIINDGQIILQKQMIISNVAVISKKIITIICEIYKIDVMLSDRQSIIVANSDTMNLIGSSLSLNHMKQMDNRDNYVSLVKEKIYFGTNYLEGYFLIEPIIVDTDVIGLIILRKDSMINDNDYKIVKIIKGILINKLNI